MALQLNITHASGITCPEAYARISNISYNHTELIASVQIFANAAARASMLPTITDQSFSLPWSDSISIAGVYNLLKNEELFTEAVDV